MGIGASSFRLWGLGLHVHVGRLTSRLRMRLRPVGRMRHVTRVARMTRMAPTLIPTRMLLMQRRVTRVMTRRMTRSRMARTRVVAPVRRTGGLIPVRMMRRVAARRSPSA